MTPLFFTNVTKDLGDLMRKVKNENLFKEILVRKYLVEGNML